MLLELAVGDAYGMGFEYCDSNLHLNDLSKYVRRPANKRANWPDGLGQYTDDTQMSLAVAELLVEGTAWTPLNIASKFVECFHRDPIVGYASGFYHFLKKTRTGEEFLENIVPESDKSGAAMRATPIGVIPDIQKVKEYAEIQARVTHDTPDGVRAAIASALTTHYFLHLEGKPADLPRFIAEEVDAGDYAWDEEYVGKVGSKGHMSVRAAITAVARNNCLSKCLLDCINFSGDVDTVAVIAMAASSCSKDYIQDLPSHLIYGLRDDKFGRSYIEKLDVKLKEKYELLAK